jgi:hypothetical protein
MQKADLMDTNNIQPVPTAGGGTNCQILSTSAPKLSGGLMALAAVGVQASPLPPARAATTEFNAAAPIELVREGCGWGLHRHPAYVEPGGNPAAAFRTVAGPIRVARFVKGTWVCEDIAAAPATTQSMVQGGKNGARNELQLPALP